MDIKTNQGNKLLQNALVGCISKGMQVRGNPDRCSSFLMKTIKDKLALLLGSIVIACLIYVLFLNPKTGVLGVFTKKSASFSTIPTFEIPITTSPDTPTPIQGQPNTQISNPVTQSGYRNYGWYMHNGQSMQYVNGNWYATPQQGVGGQSTGQPVQNTQGNNSQPQTVSIPCTTAYGTYTEIGTTYEDAQAQCANLQAQAINSQANTNSSIQKVQDAWNKYANNPPPVMQPAQTLNVQYSKTVLEPKPTTCYPIPGGGNYCY